MLLEWFKAYKVGDEALGPEAGGIWLGARLEDCRPAAGGADAAAALLRAAAVPASETARVIGSAGPGKKPICVDVAGPATVEDFIRRLLNDASDGSSSAAAFAARRDRTGEHRSQHHRLTRLEPAGRDPADGATLVKATVSTYRHFLHPEAAAPAAASAPAFLRVERINTEVEAKKERERVKAASAPKAADTIGPQGKSRRMGSGKR